MSSETTASTDHSGALEHDGHDSPGVGHGDVAHGHGDIDHEQPSDWGWNAEMGNWASRAGWIVVVILLLMFAGVTHYNLAGFLAQLLVIIGLVVILLWDRARKRTAWRD